MKRGYFNRLIFFDRLNYIQLKSFNLFNFSFPKLQNRHNIPDFYYKICLNKCKILFNKNSFEIFSFKPVLIKFLP